MIQVTVPNWFRIALIFLSILSFVPQLQQVWARKDSAGISPFYVLFILLWATQDMARALFYLVDPMKIDFFMHKPLILGDWLNLAHLIIIWALALHLSASVWHFAPSRALRTTKLVAIIYAIFFLLSASLVAFSLYIVLSTENPSDSSDVRFGLFLFMSPYLFVTPVVTILLLSALPLQARETRAQPDALSVDSLAAQAAVFAIVAVSWMYRVAYAKGEERYPGWELRWYSIYGFPAVNSGIFAVMQFVLLYLAKKHEGRATPIVVNAEEEPLLGH